MTPELLVLADDLTGALESGAAFSQRGIPTMVAWGQYYSFDVPVLVIDTETRHLSAVAAGDKIKHLADSIPARLIYKKTDSTLRGNIRAELLAIAHLGTVTYVPAYPKQGRTVLNDHLHVHGVPVEQTDFATDPVHPVVDGNLAHLLGPDSHVLISEANTDEAIGAAAQTWLRTGGVAAGPAAMLHAAAKVLAITPRAPSFPRISKVLVVLGSRNECSLHQVGVASGLFSTAQWQLMDASKELEGDAIEHAARFGIAAAKRLASGEFDACIIIGGDTAFATLKALRCSSLEPIGEIIPGVPVSILPNGLTLITKAGGFGSPYTLLELHQRLAHA